ncbi:MAG TPA: hypothetical protein VJ911_05870 [Cryomorphaceae bacterium]|nr:hypothetical protein [Cryomorphaceae bacterium]
MKKLINLFSLTVVLLSFAACGEQTDAVESGVYEGTVDKVEPAKTEIYVKTVDDKTLELYFTEATKLTRNGEVVPFDALEAGQTVKVEIEKIGKRLDPISVEILEQ